jgi:hypothetical protein
LGMPSAARWMRSSNSDATGQFIPRIDRSSLFAPRASQSAALFHYETSTAFAQPHLRPAGPGSISGQS